MAKFKRKTQEEREKEIKELSEMMQNKITDYFEKPELIQEHLEFMANFHNYSVRNMALIDAQFKGARAVGSFNFWKSKGISIKKGEKGIKILVPTPVEYFNYSVDEKGKTLWKQIKYATDEEKEKIEQGIFTKKTVMFYKVGHVFEYTQTDAREKGFEVSQIFGRYHRDGTIENDQEFMRAFEKIADILDVKISKEPLEELGTAKGAFYPKLNIIALNPRNTMAENIPVMVHELAHAALHNEKVKAKRERELSVQEKEFQAEMVSYVVCARYGIKTENFSLPYLANWTKNATIEDKEQLLNEVRQTASAFIHQIDKHFEQVNLLEKDKTQNISAEKYSVIDFGTYTSEIKDVDLEGLKDTVATVVDQFMYGKEERIRKISDFLEASQLTGEHLQSIYEATNHNLFIFNKDEINKPMLLIQYSESDKLKPFEFMRFGEANHKLAELEKLHANEEKEVSYFKTKYHVLIKNEKGEIDVISNRIDLGDGYYKSPYQQLISENNLSETQHKEILTELAVYSHEKSKGNLDLKEPSMLVHGVMSEFREFGKVNHVCDADYRNLKDLKTVNFTVAVPEQDKITLISGSYENGENARYLNPLHYLEHNHVPSDIYNKLNDAWQKEVSRQEEKELEKIIPIVKKNFVKHEQGMVR